LIYENTTQKHGEHAWASMSEHRLRYLSKTLQPQLDPVEI
jgi:hypothetical protein